MNGRHVSACRLLIIGVQIEGAVNEIQTQLMNLLRDQRERLVQDAVERQYRRYARIWETYGQAGRAKSVRDMGYHLDFLLAAVTAGDASLFSEYVGWLKVLFAGLGFSESVVADTLAALRESLGQHLSGEALLYALSYVDAAIAYAQVAPSRTATVLDPQAGTYPLARAYLDALLHSDRDRATRLVLDAVAEGMSIRDIYLDVIQATQWRSIFRMSPSSSSIYEPLPA